MTTREGCLPATTIIIFSFVLAFFLDPFLEHHAQPKWIRGVAGLGLIMGIYGILLYLWKPKNKKPDDQDKP